MAASAIEVRGLVKRFGELTAVAGIDFDVPAGTCVGLLGPNGAGKTTTVEMLEGLQEPTAGEIRVLGTTWAERGDYLRSRMGITLQRTEFPPNVTVEEILRLFRSLYPSGLKPEDVLRKIGLWEKRRAYTQHLSGGQAQRLSIGTALVGDPELLFLDEPTTGLDPQARQDLWDVIRDFKARGRTVLLTTHYMDEAQTLCDHLFIVDHGRVVARGTPNQLIHSIGGEQVVEISSQPEVSEESLRSVAGVRRVASSGGGWAVGVENVTLSLPSLLAVVQQQGATLSHLSVRRTTLDDVFLTLTGRRLDLPETESSP